MLSERRRDGKGKKEIRKITGESWGQPQGWCIGCLCSAVVKYQMNSGGFLKEDSIKGHRLPGGERLGSWPLVCRKLWLEAHLETPSPCRGGGAVKAGALPMSADQSESPKLADGAERCLGIAAWLGRRSCSHLGWWQPAASGLDRVLGPDLVGICHTKAATIRIWGCGVDGCFKTVLT